MHLSQKRLEIQQNRRSLGITCIVNVHRKKNLGNFKTVSQKRLEIERNGQNLWDHMSCLCSQQFFFQHFENFKNFKKFQKI